MIEKFCGVPTPAVGFSIGFERIFSILSEQNFYPDTDRKKVALFYENNFIQCMKLSESIKKLYDVSVFEKPKKVGKFLDRLTELNYYGYCVVDESSDVKILKEYK